MKTWEDVIKFHVHECPGLAIGYKVVQAAQEYLEGKVYTIFIIEKLINQLECH